MTHLRALPALTFLLLAGCVTEVVQRGPGRNVGDAPRPAPRKRTDTAGIAAAILPLGSVPFVNRALPLVSPDGASVATVAGDAPPWPTVLAEPGAPEAPASGVQIFRLDRSAGVARGVAAVPEPVLLGRGGDAAGFLVESVRSGGARWIGRVPWNAGAIDWLVGGEEVNAFAGLGPGGRLAWSRRRAQSDAEGDAGGEPDHFDLVVRDGAQVFVVSAQGGDWLLPTWSDGGAAFYVLRLESGRLELRYLSVAGGSITTVAALHLADAARRADAYQAMASSARMVGVPRPGGEHLVFWHPGARRMAFWRPLESPGAAAFLAPGSIAAALDAMGLAVVATPEHLVVQRPANSADQRVLVPGPQIPRPVSDAVWPYVLLSPRDSRIDLMAFSIIGLQP